MRPNENPWFYMGGSGLDRTDYFQKFGGSGLGRIRFYRTRLDSHWKISHSHCAHLYCQVTGLCSGRIPSLTCSVSLRNNEFIPVSFVCEWDFRLEHSGEGGGVAGDASAPPKVLICGKSEQNLGENLGKNGAQACLTSKNGVQRLQERPFLVTPKTWFCCNLSGGVALIVWFTTNGMCAKNKNIDAWREEAFNKRDCNAWSLLLLAATVRSFAHMSLGISHRNKMVLWPGCGGRAEFSLTQRTCDRCGSL